MCIRDSEKTVHAQHAWWFPEEDGSEPNLYGNFRSNINNLLPNDHYGKLGFGAPNKCLVCSIEPLVENYDTDMTVSYTHLGERRPPAALCRGSCRIGRRGGGGRAGKGSGDRWQRGSKA